MRHQVGHRFHEGLGVSHPPGRLFHAQATVLRVIPAVIGLARVVHQQGQIKLSGVIQLFEQIRVKFPLAPFRLPQPVQLIQANQGMFVRRVNVKKLVLNQTGQLAEFRHIFA